MIHLVFVIGFDNTYLVPQDKRIQHKFSILLLRIPDFRMAKTLGSASDGDSNRDGSTANPPHATTISTVPIVNQRQAANENTSLNTNLDTYFSDEKIIIPENINVSNTSLQSEHMLTKFSNHFSHTGWF